MIAILVMTVSITNASLNQLSLFMAVKMMMSALLTSAITTAALNLSLFGLFYNKVLSAIAILNVLEVKFAKEEHAHSKLLLLRIKMV